MDVVLITDCLLLMDHVFMLLSMPSNFSFDSARHRDCYIVECLNFVSLSEEC